MTRNLAELRAPQVAELISEDSILIQPLGAIEQHGPHLPHNVDLLVADAVSQAVVDRFGDDLDLWLLPPLAYTRSTEHAWSPGSVWLSAETLTAVLGDLGRSLALLPARRLVFLNGHGGNSSLLNVICRKLRLEHDLLTFLMHPAVPPDQGGASAPSELGMGVHGGADETSIMLHLRPDLVDMSLAEANIPEALAHNEFVKFGGRVTFGWMSNDFGPSGVIGDPTGATAEAGRAHFEGAVAALGDALAEVARFDLPMG